MKAIAKQVLFGLLAVAMLLSLVACGDKTDGGSTSTTAPTGVQGSDVTPTVSGGADDPADPTQGGDVVTTPNQSQGGQQQQGGAQTKLTWAQVKAQMPANLRGTTVKIYNWNNIESITDAAKVADKFTQETGIKVDWKYGGYNTYITEIAAKQAAKDAPDLIRLKEVNPAAMALLQPLANSGYNFNDTAWDKPLMDAYSYNGKAYATNLVDTLMQQPDVYMYNKELIQKYELDDPYTLWQQGKWTWNKFVEICTAFADEADDGFYAFSYNNGMNGAHMLGTDFVTYQDGKYVSNMSSKKLQQGAQMYSRLRRAGILTASAYQRTVFEAGNILFHHDSIIGARKTHFYNVAAKAKGTLGVVPVPSVDGQTTYYQLYRELEAYGIPFGAKNAAAAPYFLRYFLDSANYNKNNFFANATVLKVYNYCMSQKNRIATNTCSTILTAETGAGGLGASVIGASEGQIASILATNKNVVESAVRQANLKMQKDMKN